MRTIKQTNTQRPLINKSEVCTKLVIAGGAALIGYVLFCRKKKREEKSHARKKEIEHEYWKRKQEERKNTTTAENKESEAEPKFSYEPQDESINEVIERAKDFTQQELFGDYLRTGDICVIFSPPGEGKSAFTMQIAIGVATSKGTKWFDGNDGENAPQTVIMYDAEQEDYDIKKRYGQDGMEWPANLRRSKIRTFESKDKLLYDVEQRVSKLYSDATIIIDNLTAVCPSMQGDDVRNFYDALKAYKESAKNRGVRVTYILVQHTTKELSYPLNLSQMAGSSNISNFATAVYAISPTRCGNNTKMLVCLKRRDKAKSDKATVMHLEEHPFLHFVFDKEEQQSEVMPRKIKASSPKSSNKEAKEKKESSPTMKKQILELLASNPDLSDEEIIEKVGCGPKHLYNTRKLLTPPTTEE